MCRSTGPSRSSKPCPRNNRPGTKILYCTASQEPAVKPSPNRIQPRLTQGLHTFLFPGCNTTRHKLMGLRRCPGYCTRTYEDHELPFLDLSVMRLPESVTELRINHHPLSTLQCSSFLLAISTPELGNVSYTTKFGMVRSKQRQALTCHHSLPVPEGNGFWTLPAPRVHPAR